MLWLCYYLAILAGAWTFSLYAKQSEHKQQNTYIIILALEAHQPSSSYSKQLCFLKGSWESNPLTLEHILLPLSLPEPKSFLSVSIQVQLFK